VDKEGTEGALPGLGLTEDQLFFVGFSRVSMDSKSVKQFKSNMRQREHNQSSLLGMIRSSYSRMQIEPVALAL